MYAAGAVDVIETKLLKNAGWHNMGTARMGTDPNTVVNEWGRCHDVKNLFVIDGSIFVTVLGLIQLDDSGSGPVYCRAD